MNSLFALLIAAFVVVASSTLADSSKVVGLEVQPAAIKLSGKNAVVQLVVTVTLAGGAVADVTRLTRFEGKGLIEVSADGRARGARDGTGSLGVEYAGRRVKVPAEVEGVGKPMVASLIKKPFVDRPPARESARASLLPRLPPGALPGL